MNSFSTISSARSPEEKILHFEKNDKRKVIRPSGRGPIEDGYAVIKITLRKKSQTAVSRPDKGRYDGPPTRVIRDFLIDCFSFISAFTS